jgi:hypothetical protein
MDRRSWLPWLLGALAAAAAAGLALRDGTGTLDNPLPPPPPPPPIDPGTGERPIRRGLPIPRLPEGFPAPAAGAIRAVWKDIEGGRPESAAAALATLTPVAAESPFMACAPAALEALAPALMTLIEGHADVALPAMRCAAALARAGGAEGRAALGRTGLVTMGFARHALAGAPALQVETAHLLGFAGGDMAQQILVVLLGKTRPEEVRAAAAAALGEAFPLEHRLRADAIEAVLAAAADGEPVNVRRSALRTVNRAWEAFRPYEPGTLAAAALSHGDRGLQLAAATFFVDHRITAARPALVAAVAGADTEVLAALAEALAGPEADGWREALEKRLPAVKDPATIRAVEMALGRERRDGPR